MSNQLEKIKELIERRAVARIGGGEKAIAKQHEKGNTQHASVWLCCLTRVASKKWTCSLSTDARTSEWRKNIIRETV